MRLDKGELQLSATDLAKHLACRHLTNLDFLATQGKIERSHWHDPAVAVLEERGFRHEAAYLAHLHDRGYEIVRIENELELGDRRERTLNAIKSGARVIAQAYLRNGQWQGRPDVLLRVETPSTLGTWSYEVVDTKLARETRGGTILQLCLYSELVAAIQGNTPEQMHVIVPGRDFQPETYRLHDYLAYYSFVKSRLESEVLKEQLPITYPEPVEHCEICSWWSECNDRRRKDDHLSFVAGISKLHMGELRKWNISSLESLATMPMPLRNRPDRGSLETFEKLREQSRLQLEYRTSGNPLFELFDLEPGFGLARLPAPSPGDVFLDFESDPFVGTDGIEYLLGYVTLNDGEQPHYTAMWSLTRPDERRAFELFIDTISQRLSQFADLHIYHFTHYEPTALKRLMGRYATRQDEMDRLLRAGTFVDLHAVLKQSLRASVEKYSLKDMEMFYGFQRRIDLRDARHNLRILESALELNDAATVPQEPLKTIEDYNRDDCLSTLALRNWLETIRERQVNNGNAIPRPIPQPGDPSEAVDERRKLVLDLMDRLLQGVPEEPETHTPEQHARWLLAQMLEWHRREEKSLWWEYFRLRDLTDEERMEDRSAISGLEFIQRIGGTQKSPIHRYSFPLQETDVREGDDLEMAEGKFGSVVAINIAQRTVDVKKPGAVANMHPISAFIHNRVGAKELTDSLFRLGTWISQNFIDAAGRYRAGRDLLLRNPPRLRAGISMKAGHDIIEDAKRLVLELDCGVLPIQGPPGAGKTFIGARMICSLIRQNRKVGITAVSHKVIRKLCDEVVNAAREENLVVRGIQKVGEKNEAEDPNIAETTKNQDVREALVNNRVDFAGGTAWLWSRPECAESVDVLFVDEAGQMSLADVLALSQGTKSIVLLGDPQQLEQPLTGVHPPGVAVSALQHILGSNKTMPPELGLFLKETWRLSPPICRFTSELFYENRLESHDVNNTQQIVGPTQFAGSGVWFVPVAHDGNQSVSDEETAAVASIVADLIRPYVFWVDLNSQRRPLSLSDILIVAPYNAQVFNLAKRLPGARIGTVDRFQGQEAPIVIYSMTTSSPEDAPHGMEFLYNLNRLNVATSRARCACILVASPRLFEPECKTPRQMKLANALCRYLELAQILKLDSSTG